MNRDRWSNKEPTCIHERYNVSDIQYITVCSINKLKMSREFIDTQVRHLVRSQNPRGVLNQVTSRSAHTVVSRIRCAVRDRYLDEIGQDYMQRFRLPGNTNTTNARGRKSKVAIRDSQKVIDRCRRLLHARGTEKRNHHQVILASPLDVVPLYQREAKSSKTCRENKVELCADVQNILGITFSK